MGFVKTLELGLWLGDHCSIGLMAWRTLFN